jgi:hypothetical protein
VRDNFFSLGKEVEAIETLPMGCQEFQSATNDTMRIQKDEKDGWQLVQDLSGSDKVIGRFDASVAPGAPLPVLCSMWVKTQENQNVLTLWSLFTHVVKDDAPVGPLEPVEGV